MKQPSLKYMTGKEVAAMCIQNYHDMLAGRSTTFSNVEIDKMAAELERHNPREHYNFRISMWETVLIAHFCSDAASMLREASLRLVIMTELLHRFVVAADIETVKNALPEKAAKHSAWFGLGWTTMKPSQKSLATITTSLQNILEDIAKYFSYKAVIEAYSHKIGVNCLEPLIRQEESIESSIKMYNHMHKIKNIEVQQNLIEEERIFPGNLILPEINLQKLSFTKEQQLTLEQKLSVYPSQEWLDKAIEEVELWSVR